MFVAFHASSDVVVAIDSVLIDGKSMDQVAGLFRGAVGSDVVIDVLRRGQVLAHPCSSLLLEAHALDLSMFLTSTPFLEPPSHMPSNADIDLAR